MPIRKKEPTAPATTSNAREAHARGHTRARMHTVIRPNALLVPCFSCRTLGCALCRALCRALCAIKPRAHTRLLPSAPHGLTARCAPYSTSPRPSYEPRTSPRMPCPAARSLPTGCPLAPHWLPTGYPLATHSPPARHPLATRSPPARSLASLELTLRHRSGTVTRRRMEGLDGRADCFLSFAFELVMPHPAADGRALAMRERRAAKTIQSQWGGRASGELRGLWKLARSVVDTVAEHYELEDRVEAGGNVLFKAAVQRYDHATLAAASAFEVKHTRFRMQASHRLHVVRSLPEFDRIRSPGALTNAINDVARNRFIAPDRRQEEATVAREAGERKKKAYSPYDPPSIWLPRVKWADGKDLYDHDDAMRHRFFHDWRRALQLGAVKVIMKFDEYAEC